MKRSSPIKRKSRVKNVNRRRKAKEFARAYHSEARVQFVQAQPCAACGRQNGSENAHLLGNGGMGRKGAYTTIGPLCGAFVNDCHGTFDRDKMAFYYRFPGFNPVEEAARTERQWLAYLAENEQ